MERKIKFNMYKIKMYETCKNEKFFDNLGKLNANKKIVSGSTFQVHVKIRK